MFNHHPRRGAGVLLASLAAVLFSTPVMAQPAGYNYDESKVPKYTLPDPLTLDSGEKVTDAATWKEKRRAEVLELFKQHMYGRMPEDDALKNISYKVTDHTRDALDGKATRKQVTIFLTEKKMDGPHMNLLMYIPNEVKGPAPVFIGLNFKGNHTIQDDPGIHVADSWVRNDKRIGVTNNQASEESRGLSSSRWPVEAIVDRGYALATIYYGDIDPDFHDGWKNGVHPLFPKLQDRGDNMTSIGAWAWGLSRALDYFETDDAIDHKHVAVLGHSRLGKTSLWAGATDDRFALVISNNSGCGGAALSRRAFGETVKRINSSFPHWFCDNFKKYNDNESEMPLDQHMLIALMAPRPVYVASAEQDKWADPRGEFLSCLHANPVYKLFDKEGLPAKKMPPIDKPVAGTIGYHIRSGGHDVKKFDWEQYLEFADKHFGKK